VQSGRKSWLFVMVTVKRDGHGRLVHKDEFSYDHRHMLVYIAILATLMLPLSYLLQPYEVTSEVSQVSEISAREKALFAATVGRSVEVVATATPKKLIDNVNVNLMIFFMFGVVLATYVYQVHKNQHKKK